MSSNEFRQQWIAALRSGKYRQCLGTLDTGEACCALGVACRLMSDQLEVLTLPNGVVFYNQSTKYPPAIVLEKLGLPDWRRVAYLNDTGCTFEEIANLVEQHLQEAVDSCPP